MFSDRCIWPQLDAIVGRCMRSCGESMNTLSGGCLVEFLQMGLDRVVASGTTTFAFAVRRPGLGSRDNQPSYIWAWILVECSWSFAVILTAMKNFEERFEVQISINLPMKLISLSDSFRPMGTKVPRSQLAVVGAPEKHSERALS